jgi:hypothetical protein
MEWWTDTMQLTVTFGYIANSPKKRRYCCVSMATMVMLTHHTVTSYVPIILIPFGEILKSWIAHYPSVEHTAISQGHRAHHNIPHLTILTSDDPYETLCSRLQNIHPSYIPRTSQPPTSHYANNTRWPVWTIAFLSIQYPPQLHSQPIITSYISLC